jgi:stress response protein SCP2
VLWFPVSLFAAFALMPIIRADADSKAGMAPPGQMAAVPHAGGGGAHGATFKVDERFPLPGLRKLMVGLSWDLLRKGSVDLDASCVLFDAAGQYITAVYFGNLSTASCPALEYKPLVTHSGDNRDGAGEGDDEQISIQLDGVRACISACLCDPHSRQPAIRRARSLTLCPISIVCLFGVVGVQLPGNVRSMVFSVTSYGGDPFWGVSTAAFRMVDITNGHPGVELVRVCPRCLLSALLALCPLLTHSPVLLLCPSCSLAINRVVTPWPPTAHTQPFC